MEIDFSPLQKALGSLERALRRSLGAPTDEEVRDAVIQRFEYCHEMAFKMLKRQIERESPTPEVVDRLAYNDMIREAAERGFPVAVADWAQFRHARNLTSDLYNEATAREVYAVAQRFLPQARALLDALLQRPAD